METISIKVLFRFSQRNARVDEEARFKTSNGSRFRGGWPRASRLDQKGPDGGGEGSDEVVWALLSALNLSKRGHEGLRSEWAPCNLLLLCGR